MANGDYLSIEELKELAKPINAIKQSIDNFAKDNDIEPFYYSRGWVHVELKWKNSFNLECLEQFSMDDDKSSYGLGIAVYTYIGKDYYHKATTLFRGLKPPFDISFIISEFKKGVDLCNSWKLADLSLISQPRNNMKL
jgi:hypothetical protein